MAQDYRGLSTAQEDRVQSLAQLKLLNFAMRKWCGTRKVAVKMGPGNVSAVPVSEQLLKEQEG